MHVYGKKNLRCVGGGRIFSLRIRNSPFKSDSDFYLYIRHRFINHCVWVKEISKGYFVYLA